MACPTHESPDDDSNNLVFIYDEMCDILEVCIRLHYPRRPPAQYIISVKPARSEATWRLVK